ncbi:hypothetical protein HRR83_004234 [Exophiala dermatitidis]|uniref:Uncharacterized protein n=1 Tax=Exophiala dermatitidis TaxID=5970 RepID=A0AAN6EWA8_EXODE|nr:hypothetical protein HRR73_006303 [Exophiala dermatitidis]KAJ4521460.1 hypothetical protein HRR74_003284 [Exophiala dermatitidis]KAJ4542134.1 hypothetical protein HRR77_006019 [Exophiala dermatitidis]KAJ4544899.1 hypothetical protein HRR76_002936 [Exophiala dermatitidis]KAJ4565374.1 hypothetical protein HRR79_005637 [Exophiala dermatitidis]
MVDPFSVPVGLHQSTVPLTAVRAVVSVLPGFRNPSLQTWAIRINLPAAGKHTFRFLELLEVLTSFSLEKAVKCGPAAHTLPVSIVLMKSVLVTVERTVTLWKAVWIVPLDSPTAWTAIMHLSFLGLAVNILLLGLPDALTADELVAAAEDTCHGVVLTVTPADRDSAGVPETANLLALHWPYACEIRVLAIGLEGFIRVRFPFFSHRPASHSESAILISCETAGQPESISKWCDTSKNALEIKLRLGVQRHAWVL